MIYPAFLLVFLGGLIAFVIEFIVPQFAKLYADMDVQLPSLTTFVISFAMQVKHFSLLIVSGGWWVWACWSRRRPGPSGPAWPGSG